MPLPDLNTTRHNPLSPLVGSNGIKDVIEYLTESLNSIGSIYRTYRIACHVIQYMGRKYKLDPTYKYSQMAIERPNLVAESQLFN